MVSNLRFIRISKEVKLINLARETRLSPSLLSQIETGKLRGSMATQQKIAQALGISEKVLFGKR